MNGYIYKIVNDFDDKIYVGQTIDPVKRWNKHKSVAKNFNEKYKSYIYNSMHKYGIEHFHFEIIEECDIDVLDERERYWIKKLNTLVPNGYNLTPGGNVLREKDNCFYGKRHTEESKRKMSEKLSGTHIGKNNPMYGKHHTGESIQKIIETSDKNGVYKESSKKNERK